jgi:hypothetical protein
MPLTKTGLKIKRNFLKEYGKKKGTSFFYAFENKYPERRLVQRK